MKINFTYLKTKEIENWFVYYKIQMDPMKDLKAVRMIINYRDYLSLSITYFQFQNFD